MKRKLSIVLTLFLTVLLTGCNIITTIKLPENPVVFKKGTIEGDSQNASYMTILWEDRVYVPYAVFSDYYGDKVERCLGYLENEISGSNTDYVCKLVGQSEYEFLMLKDFMVSTDFPLIFRELSVKGEPEIKGVEPLGYLFWENYK